MAIMIKLKKFIIFLNFKRYIEIDYPDNLRKLFLETGDSFYSKYIKIEIEEQFEEIN